MVESIDKATEIAQESFRRMIEESKKGLDASDIEELGVGLLTPDQAKALVAVNIAIIKVIRSTKTN